MTRKKSLAVLITLIQKKVSSLKGDERQSYIKLIEITLIAIKVFSKEEVIKEEADFQKFVNDVTKYIEEQHMERAGALELVLNKYPQYRNTNELLN